MPEDAPRPAQTAIRTDLGAIFVSMELSRRAWLITSLSPGGVDREGIGAISVNCRKRTVGILYTSMQPR